MLHVRSALFALPLLLLAALPSLAQSRTGEMRGVWMGSGYGRDWPALMQSLKENGFNAIFPNMSTGGAAFYPSKVLPAAPGVPKGRDELAEAVKAAKQYGIELHVWHIAWMLDDTSPEVVRQYEAEGRLMRNAQGAFVRDDPTDAWHYDWLCPSNEKNRKQEKEAVLELVRRYDIAGVQLDYMRFPSADYCFCDTCKVRFQKDTGTEVKDWPAEVFAGGKYAARYEQWRQGLQTSLVREISQEAHRIKPATRLSLAAWPEQGEALHHVLQDWPTWTRQGLLDFLCFMTYTTDRKQLDLWLTPAIGSLRGSVPVYAGLGAFMMKDSAQLTDQVTASRELGADGFVAFAYYSGDLDKWLPRLRATVTASDPGPLPHQAPSAWFKVTGAAVLGPPEARQAKAGGKLTVALQLGKAAEKNTEDLSAAAGMLRDQINPRKAMPNYETAGPSGATTAGPQLAGRVVVETPSGEMRALVAAFTGGESYQSTFTFTVPSGPFRIAVYGTEQDGKKTERPFVARGMLMTGVVDEPAPSAGTAHEKLSALVADFVKQVKPEEIAGLSLTAQLDIAGDGGGDWWFRAKEGVMDSGEGTTDAPDLTISCSVEDALAMARGEVDPTALLASGRLTMAGDLQRMRQLLPLLRKVSGGG